MKVLIGGTNVSGKYTPDELSALTVMLSAFDGEIGQGSLPQPDPAETAEWYAGQSAKITSSDDLTTIVDGFVGEQRRERGPRAKGRIDTITLQDDNALLYGFRAHGWSRPAETDRARVMAFAAAYLPVAVTTTWVLATNTATLPAKTYDTTDLFSELLQDVRDATGKTLYIEHRDLHAHLISEGQTPSFAISDAAYDFAATWPPSPGAQRTKDPAELKNDVLARNSAGATGTATDSGSITRYDAGGLKHQDIIDFPDAPAGDLAGLAAKTVAATKDERITYTIECGPFTDAQTALVVPGGLITVTCGEVGLSAATQRVANVTWRFAINADGTSWWAKLELGFPLRVRGKTPRTPIPVAPTSTDYSAPITADDDVTGACSLSGSNAALIVGEPSTPGAFELVSIGTGYARVDSGGLGTNGCDVGQSRWYGGPASVCRYVTITPSCKPAGALIVRWSGTVSNAATDGVSNDFGVYVYFCTAVPVGFDEGQLLGMFHAAAPLVIDVPASWVTASAAFYLLFSPVSRKVDGPTCLGNFQRPINAAAGHAYGYNLPPGANQTVAWMAIDGSQTGTADWLPVVEAADGSRVTFTLAGWDGTGSPQVAVNGLPANVASTAASSQTVTLSAPPPAGALVTARYHVVTA